MEMALFDTYYSSTRMKYYMFTVILSAYLFDSKYSDELGLQVALRNFYNQKLSTAEEEFATELVRV